jgi:hypothetical protein
LHLDGEVTLRRLGEALDAWTELLREVTTDVAGATGRDARFVVTEAQAVERSATRPKHFSDAALLKVRDLGRLTSPETPVVKVGNGTAPIALSSRLLANVEAVLAPEVKSIGTIEGKLEGLIIHGSV